MANILYTPGTLNRLRAKVTFTIRDDLNVISNYLTEAGISFSLDGEATTMLPAMMSLIASPAPYMRATVTISLIRSIPLATLYKTTLETDTRMGTAVIFPDTDQLVSFAIYNTAVESIRELALAGREAAMVVTMVGYYITNQDYYDGHTVNFQGSNTAGII